MVFEQIFGLLGAVVIAIFIGFLLAFAITNRNEKSNSEESMHGNLRLVDGGLYSFDTKDQVNDI